MATRKATQPVGLREGRAGHRRRLEEGRLEEILALATVHFIS